MLFQEKWDCIQSPKIEPEIGERAEIPENEAAFEDSKEIGVPNVKILWFRDGSQSRRPMSEGITIIIKDSFNV